MKHVTSSVYKLRGAGETWSVGITRQLRMCFVALYKATHSSACKSVNRVSRKVSYFIA